MRASSGFKTAHYACTQVRNRKFFLFFLFKTEETSRTKMSRSQQMSRFDAFRCCWIQTGREVSWDASGLSADISFDARRSTFPGSCWRCCPVLAHPACDLTASGKARCVDALFITQPDSKRLLLSQELFSQKGKIDLGSIRTSIYLECSWMSSFIFHFILSSVNHYIYAGKSAWAVLNPEFLGFFIQGQAMNMG